MSQPTPASGPNPATVPSGVTPLPAAHTGAVVAAATAFLETLSDAQRAAVQPALSPENAGRWSNFPAGVVPRNGLFLRDLNAEQRDAALAVARATLSRDGFARLEEIRSADDVYAKISQANRTGRGGPGGGGGRGPGGAGRGDLFGQNNYAIALLGKPSKTEPWLLQFGGHHLAVNHYYHGDAATATPYHVGIEPITWADEAGTTHDPLRPMREAMQGLLESLTPDQQQIARLNEVFEDVSVGPGRDGQFPARPAGLAYSQLSEAGQAAVRRAILAWTGDTPQADAYRQRYFAELDLTHVAFSGTGGLKAVRDYVRIDGPQLWIELACQPSRTEFPIHFHTVWRDRTLDYGNALRPPPWRNGGGPR